MEEVEENKPYRVIGMFEECDLCHNEYPIHTWNRYEDDLYKPKVIIFNGKQFLCEICCKE